MRTDAKVGLICGFVLVLAVVAYYAFPPASKTAETGVGGNASELKTGSTDKPDANRNLGVAPPGGTTAPSPDLSAPSGGSTLLGGPSGLAQGGTFGGPVGGSTGSVSITGPGMASTTGPGTGLHTAGSGTPTTPTTGPGSALGGPLTGTLGGDLGGGPGGLAIGGSGSGGSSGSGGGLASGTTGGGLTGGSGGSLLGGATGSTFGGSGTFGGPGARGNTIEVEPTTRPGGRRGTVLDGSGMGLGSGLRESTVGGGSGHGGSSVGGGLLGGGTVGGGGRATGGSAAGTGSGTTYSVVRGDVLTTIAKKNHVTLKALQAANPGVNPNRLLINSKLNIPAPTATAVVTGGSGGRATTRPATTRPASGARAATTRSSAVTRTAGAAGSRTLAPGSTYTVKRGDTLRKIAKAAYGDENMWRRIARTNRADLPNPNILTAGQTLRLPPR